MRTLALVSLAVLFASGCSLGSSRTKSGPTLRSYSSGDLPVYVDSRNFVILDESVAGGGQPSPETLAMMPSAATRP